MAKIYVSSSFEDLQRERGLVCGAIRNCGHEPIGMEAYNAFDSSPLEYCLTDIHTCNLYIGICAWRYGSIPEGQEMSITELEYEEAKKRGIPRLIFLLEKTAAWPMNLADEDRTRVNAWRKRLGQERIVSHFSNSEELRANVIAAIFQHYSAAQPKANPIGVALPEIPRLLPFLCDRSRQELKFRGAVEKNQSCPLVCIVHGEESQGHDMFLRRIKEDFLPRFLDLRTAVTLFSMAWPPYFRGLDELHGMLESDLARNVKGPLITTEAVNRELANIPGPVLAHTHVLTENWITGGEQVLEGFLEFWQRWPVLAPGQRLFVFLFIQYQYRGNIFTKLRFQAVNQKISRALDHLNSNSFKEFDRIAGVVLPRLDNVTKIEAENWARSRQVAEFCQDEGEYLVEEVKNLFEVPIIIDSIPMNVLARELKGILARRGLPKENFI